jgi:hypothetical protein
VFPEPIGIWPKSGVGVPTAVVGWAIGVLVAIIGVLVDPVWAAAADASSRVKIRTVTSAMEIRVFGLIYNLLNFRLVIFRLTKHPSATAIVRPRTNELVGVVQLVIGIFQNAIHIA